MRQMEQLRQRDRADLELEAWERRLRQELTASPELGIGGPGTLRIRLTPEPGSSALTGRDPRSGNRKS